MLGARMDPKEPVKVYDAWNSQQAQFLCQLLADAGISARVASDAVETLSGKVPFQKATCPIWVAASDAERARSILVDDDKRLQDHDAPQTQPKKTYCYHCGDAVQSGQSPCPHCGCDLNWTD